MKLEKLWNLTGTERSNNDGEENLFFDPVGLNLIKEPLCWGYWCTPVNTISFAATGGDGVHFGFLIEDSVSLDESPIIMTVPCAETPNHVVGENLSDFLALGCRCGYFVLEQIEYQPEEQIRVLDSQEYPEYMSTEEQALLLKIEKEFNLAPWIDHGKRLKSLKEKYFLKLKYSEEYYEIKA